MLYSCDPDNTHPYWYAQVLSIFHANVSIAGGRAMKRVDFLWVRWLGVDSLVPGGLEEQRLHSVGFIPDDEGGAFGFVDPKDVIRACHLIPDFSRGTTTELLGPSTIPRLVKDGEDEDWDGYYVNMHVDRDMFMRFVGGGIGHAESEALRTQPLPVFMPTQEEAKEDEDGESPPILETLPSQVMPVIDSPRVPAEGRSRVLNIPSRSETHNGEGDWEDDNEGDPEGDPEDNNNECDEFEGEGEDEADEDDNEGEGDGDDDALDEELGPEDGEDDYGDGEEDYEGFSPL
ncbi:hypothetical protein K474DRAFT_1609500 [Panus rudis PR-1116 ss-1]|nr:hypothetical protein K474DRAFT_1609500 [Panus rudis PR-1116 ss-1]